MSIKRWYKGNCSVEHQKMWIFQVESEYIKHEMFGIKATLNQSNNLRR